MKYIVLFCLLVSGLFVKGQTQFLKDAFTKLDKALLTKDTFTLKQLLHKDVTYGHSNGWVETKKEMVHDVTSGKLSYQKIESSDVQWLTGKDWATMRCKSAVAFVLDGKPGELQLHVLQFWLKTNKGWQLVARQSTKL